MKPNVDDLPIADESQDVFDDELFDEWLDKSGHAVLKKISGGEPIRTEEMIILVLRSQARTSRRLENEFRREIKDMRKDMAQSFAEVREDTNRHSGVMREDTDKRFGMMHGYIDLGFTAMREDMDRRFAEMREDTNRRFAEVREDMNRGFTVMRGDMNSLFSTVKWMIGLCSGILVVLMSLYRFLR